ncbi:MAG: hypothetical protein EOP06_04300 [Proteobacteria bacterium]|nr:MAG: hypothetical protein EOP06_04300 [Pseudomonadota bacterium]
MSDKKEFKLFLFHELLHILGFQHPSTDCHWLQFGCGMMGMSPYPRAIDSDTYRRTIEVTFVKSKASEK